MAMIDVGCGDNAIYSPAGEKVLFGSYPQSEVKEEALLALLNEAAGALPTERDSAGWTAYPHYIEGSAEVPFTWHIDIAYEGERYRGVYFTHYRPSWQNFAEKASTLFQKVNGYLCGRTYWFRYEPIAWRVLTEADGAALLLSERVLDAQSCYLTANGSVRTGAAGETVYENNYAYSTIRAWLNETFYGEAFSTEERERILQTTVENGARSAACCEEPPREGHRFVCEDTVDRVFLLSLAEVTDISYGFATGAEADASKQKEPTDHALVQGARYGTAPCPVRQKMYFPDYVLPQESEATVGRRWSDWWLRTPASHMCYVQKYVDAGGFISDFALCDNSIGVAPALWIKTALEEEKGESV